MGTQVGRVNADISLLINSENNILRAFFNDQISLKPEDYSSGEEYFYFMKSLCSVLCSKTTHEVIDLFKRNGEYIPKPVNSSEIPQFSDLSAAVYTTPEVIYSTGSVDLSYVEMGKMLWHTERDQGADQKYGENHAKTAALIGLVSVDRGKINITSFGKFFLTLNPAQQAALIPVLWLRVSLFQNYFFESDSEAALKRDVSVLSESTQKRRMSNVRAIIDLIKKGYYLRESNIPMADEVDEPETTEIKEPLQLIYYGSPGTGKSFTIDDKADDVNSVRTTFHPDTDYASFVGAYKPTMEDVPLNAFVGKEVHLAQPQGGHPGTERKIVYKYVPQAFLKAYVEAWKDLGNPHFLIIEEINRGNCAQIFGDLFQLLDRNSSGSSSYAIHADDDISRFLRTDEKGFAKLTDEQKNAIRSFMLHKDNGKTQAVGEDILDGKLLLLPPNLYIWATMNTSDQSLFPIDSAFKRRWNWKYIPIDYAPADKRSGAPIDWKVEVAGIIYSWGEFLGKINPEIYSLTESSDKQMGYFFAKADPATGIISEDVFLNKVLFYLWTDVFKDYDVASKYFHNKKANRAFRFTDFFEDSEALGNFIANFELTPMDSNLENVEESSKRNYGRALVVKFPDGTEIKGATQFDSYLQALEKIGLDKAADAVLKRKYSRNKAPLISKEKSDAIENSPTFSYVQSGEYFVIKGIDTMEGTLKGISNELNLGLTVIFE